MSSPAFLNTFKHVQLAPVFFLVFITVLPAAGKVFYPSSDTGRITFLLEQGRHYLDRPPAHTLRKDSAILFFARALRLSDSAGLAGWRDKTLLLLGERCLRNGVSKQGKDYFIQAIGDYHRSGEKEQEAEAWALLANAIPGQPEENLADKIQSFENARNLFRELDLPLRETDVLRGIAQAHLGQGKLDIAEKELLRVLELYRMLHYPPDCTIPMISWAMSAAGETTNSRSSCTGCKVSKAWMLRETPCWPNLIMHASP